MPWRSTPQWSRGERPRLTAAWAQAEEPSARAEARRRPTTERPERITPARKVFISYRREETAGHAGRLYDAIASRFGDANVFMDVDLAPGVDFVERVTEAVGACDVLLVVIGPNWARTTDARGNVRLAGTNDFVRLEVEIALRRPDVAVIPLLVGGAQMPAPDQLPESIRGLSRRNALELSDLRWRYDVGRLVSTLEQLLEARDVPAGAAALPPDDPDPPPPARRAGTARTRAIVAVLLALGVGAGALALAGVFSGGGGDGDRPAVAGDDGEITSDDAVALVGTYDRLYEAKDLSGLRRLLDPGVVLKQGKTQQIRGINDVSAHYRDDFRRLRTHKPVFDWEDDHQDAGEEELEVAGRYVLSIADRRATGRFGFRFRKVGSSILITEICFGCPDLDSTGHLQLSGP
jgi:hypothetical protein